MSETNLKFEYQKKNSFEQRQNLTKNINRKYPSRIPVIVEILKNGKYANSSTIEQSLLKQKYLADENMSVANFMCRLRKQLDMGTENSNWFGKGIFLMTETNTCVVSSQHMAEIYEQHKNKDGFLYLHLCEENMFG